ncbi:MAG: DUF5686 family protein [Bacteroidia bacterium]|nr:DUF5686 family protein [Bacteroidia bacterium]
MHLRILSLCLLCGLGLSAQPVLRGRVVDELTQAPLPFATVLYDTLGHRGVTTDLDGRFTLQAPGISSLTVRYIGYRSRTVPLRPGQQEIRIGLTEDAVQMQEVLIAEAQDPAAHLIRQVIRSKARNNPARLDAYSCRTYNKLVYEWLLPPADTAALDSSAQRLYRLAASTALLILESVTLRRFAQPARTEETVEASRMSGFRDPLFAALATDVQPFSFYEETVPVLNRRYLNPISDNSPAYYRFRIEDTLYQDADTVYLVSFAPKPGKRFDALTGVLYINTFGYAVQNVLAEPARQGPIEIRIEQRYTCVNREQWFPEQLNFELRAPSYPDPSMGMRASGKSYITEVQIRPPLKARTLAVETVRMLPDAAGKPAPYWTQHRADSLTARELRTYAFMDSLGAEFQLDRKVRIVESLGSGLLNLGPVSLDFNRLYTWNAYEGHRFGLGLRSTDRLPVSLGAYAAYGLRDGAWKYGADLQWRLHPAGDWRLQLSAVRDLAEPGASALDIAGGLSSLRAYAIGRMDSVAALRGSLSFRMLNYLTGEISLQRATLDPAYAYRYEALPALADPDRMPFTEAGIRLRYAWREELMQVLGRRVSNGSRFPVLTLVYTRGLDGLLGGQFAFDRLEVQAEQTLRHRLLGATAVQARAGAVQGEAPASRLFNGNGVFFRNNPGLIFNAFQTMRPYEFLSDRYVSFFLRQDLGPPLWRSAWSQPRLRLLHGMAWGSLASPGTHAELEFRTMEQGFFESGLQVQDLIRTEYVNIGYLGLGIAGFWRYGPYAGATWRENGVLRLALSFSYD